MQANLADSFVVEVVDCESEIGSGALPRATIPSAGLAVRSATTRGAGSALAVLAASLRRLPIPVIGRIENQSLLLDLRCLEDEAGFVSDLAALETPG